MKTFLGSVATSFHKALAPLRQSLISPGHFRTLLHRYGWDADLLEEDGALAAIRTALGLDPLFDAAQALMQQLEGDGADELALVPQLIDALKAIGDAVGDLEGASPAGLVFPLDQPEFWQEVPPALIDDVLTTFLEAELPAAAGFLASLGVLEYEDITPVGRNRVPYVRRTVHWGRLTTAVGSPLELLREVYRWNQPTLPFDHVRLIDGLLRLFWSFEVQARAGAAPADLLAHYYAPDHPALALLREVRIPFLSEGSPDQPGFSERGVSIVPIPPAPGSSGAPTGWLLTPFVKEIPPTEPDDGDDGDDDDEEEDPGREVFLTTEGGFDIDGGFGLAVRPGSVRFEHGTPSMDSKLGLSGTSTTSPWIVLGETAPHRIELTAFDVNTGFRGSASEPELVINAAADLALVLNPAGNALLTGILGAEPRRFAASPALVWSSRSGLSFDGNKGPSFRIPVREKLGLAFVDSLGLGLEQVAGKAQLVASASARLELGPVVLHLDGVGASVAIEPTLDGSGGLFGAVDVSASFKAPTAVRLTFASSGEGDEPAAPLDIQRFHVDDQCLAVTWTEPHLDRWLRKILPDLGEESPASAVDMTLRVVFDQGSGVREVRLDCHFPAPRVLSLPGARVEVPRDTVLSLVFGGGTGGLDRVAVVLSFDQSERKPAPSTDWDEATRLHASSNLAWERGEDRELHGDQDAPADKPLIKLSLGARRPVSLVLVDIDLGSGRLPTFLRELAEAITPLDYAQLDRLRVPTPWDPRSLSDASFHDPDLAANLFALPFLRRGDASDPQDGEAQLLQVTGVRNPQVSFQDQKVTVQLGVSVAIGAMRLATECTLGFNWEKLAFSFEHPKGLELRSTETAELTGDHLGLRWRLKGAPHADGGHHFFTLSTKDNQYQVQQAPGAVFELEYGELGEEPVVFAVTDFAVTPKGLDVTATVKDQPAKLNGINTRFRFAGSKLEIRENRINDFTLMGSGPMPPDLVGDATVDVALQLAQKDGRLTLMAGSARLQGDQLLDCKGTRFRFAIDAIGLKFVQEDGFHLYFTLTGSAQFNLAPGDDLDGPLALLSKIKIDLVDAPLTGDARVIAKHIRFMVELPRPVGFSFLGAFGMEIRGIGFVPQAEPFGGDGAMLVAGKLSFAEGAGDTPDPRTDIHKLLIGLPKKGDLVPRIHFEDLPLSLNLGSAFRLNGVVDFHDDALEKGFSGEGSLQIQGLPTFAASFSFLRIRRDETSRWVRAWFIYLEVRQISVMVPAVQLYLREVGLGFGYRYTLASIKAADEANDVKQLIKRLTELSRTQGDLSKRDRWAIDFEKDGDDPRWTVAARAMISQTSASTSPLHYDRSKEKELACLFLLDAVVALRSDLTFLMAFRGWLNANYYDYVEGDPELRERPLLSGFVLLSPRQRRLLAHAASNPNGKLGDHPPLPDFVKKAIANSQFSATLLVEPGLLHYELGWPNMLRWKDKLGPLEAEFRGGMIFRISGDELVTGTSYLARARLELKGEVNLGIVGACASATADVAFGARYIGLINLRKPLESALYGGVGLEAHIQFEIKFWIRLKIGFIKIEKTFRFSMAIDFTAGLEIGIAGIAADAVGLRGTGTLAVAMMGRRVHLSINLAFNDGAVTRAKQMTEHVLQYGLEASDVDTLPGVSPGNALVARGAGPAAMRARHRVVPAPSAAPAFAALAMTEGGKDALAMDVAALAAPTFEVPGYTVFALRNAGPDGSTYFVLIPQGEGADGEEPGFLPAPPNDLPERDSDTLPPDPVHDFRLTIPATGESYTLEQFDPALDRFEPRTAAGDGRRVIEWKADWNAVVADPELDEAVVDGPALLPFTLRRYLRHAFVTREHPRHDQEVIPLGDPDAIGTASDTQKVEDTRVHNPTDSAFESAVRGAVEQFQGSPFFKRDRNSEYEQLLEAAYLDTTTIYADKGALPDAAVDPAAAERAEKSQGAHQLRGVIVHDLVADLREHAAMSEADASTLRARSLAFRMGLVFRVRGGMPSWLERNVDAASAPTIQQRRGHGTAIDELAIQPVRTFNVATASFASNPPQFQRVQNLTDARTIAIAWDLAWENPPASTGAQSDPEHHLVHYHVRRRPLDSSEREVVYTVKPAQTMHRAHDEGVGRDVLTLLKPRFQIADHFTEDTIDDLAALPASGRSYLYTITPVDVAGNVGRPLTLVATRFPSEPPQVPASAELVVTYGIDASVTAPARAGVTAPQVIRPADLRVTWTEPPPPRDGVTVTPDKYRLIFRRDAILPVGSYGLDGATGGPRTRALPTTNARPLPTDAKIDIVATHPEGAPPDAREAVVSIDVLAAAGVFPGADAPWRPESYRIYLQTISLGGVASALAPVQLLLRVTPPDRDEDRREERRPAELEWLPRPVVLPLLPAVDQRATPGIAHVPMPGRVNADRPPQAADFRFTPSALVDGIDFAPHPAGLRCIRFRWNQGPSRDGASVAEYPLDLNAGFQILELDADAHPRETFEQGPLLARALRPIQDVQMIPAEELALTPGDTLSASQWEAWYPSTILRRKKVAGAASNEVALGPWYSWRDSLLEWPSWRDLTDDELERRPRPTAVHPVLAALADELVRPATTGGSRRFALDLQAPPPMQPGSLADFLRSTAPSADPYGWGVLQRLGLSVAFALRDPATGAPLRGQELIDEVHAVVAELLTPWAKDTIYPVGALVIFGGIHFRCLEAHTSIEASPPPTTLEWEVLGDDVGRHLHIELLFQPGRSIRIETSDADQADLLALVQISLRPAIRQHLRYQSASFQARPGLVDLVFALARPCTLIAPGAGQVEVEADAPTLVRRSIEVPLDGKAVVLMRGEQLPTIGVALPATVVGRIDLGAFTTWVTYAETPSPHVLLVPGAPALPPERAEALRRLLAPFDAAAAEALVSLVVARFAPTDTRAASFLVSPDALAPQFTTATDSAGTPGHAWARMRRLLEALSSTDPALPIEQKIRIPTATDALAAALPDLLSWSQRFFDAGGPATPDGDLASTPAGPWLATAYPRAGAPAYAAVDASGRLGYDHLLEDGWAHNYRYYLRPFGRYDLLWHSLLTSPLLFRTDRPALPPVEPDPDRGGLDVVLERIRPIEAPLVLASSRLDAPSTAASPAAPGATWEVIVAQHTEQALVEKNQTLVRQLGFRQVAFSLLRRFAYDGWPALLARASQDDPVAVTPVVAHYPAVPASYPATPDHLTLGALSDADARSLDLPLRITRFQQAAQVLQFDAMPFFYEHRLLLIAQAASTVSPVNEVTQRDFEYRTPLPVATLEAIEAEQLRARRVTVPLRRLWESLPAAAQERWPSEAPDGDHYTPAWVPDLDVIYQIVELYSGNVEVQAELAFDQKTAQFVRRQLGRRVQVDAGRPTTPASAAGRYQLPLTVQPVAEVELAGTIDPASIPEVTRRKLSVRPASGDQRARLSFVGVVTHQDRANLAGLAPADRAAIDRLWSDAFTTEPISAAPSAIPPGLSGFVDVVADEQCRLVWEGPLSAAERAALLALPGDAELRAAIQRLADAAASASDGTVTTAVAPRGPEHRPAALDGKAALVVENGAYTELTWTGRLGAAEEAALADWARIAALASAVEELVRAVGRVQVSVPVPPARPLPEELPPVLAGRLSIGDVQLGWAGPAPTDAERAALVAVVGDDGFTAARAALIAAIDAARSAPLAPEVPRPETLPPVLVGRLGITPSALTWSSPAPTDAEREALSSLTGSPGFLASVALLRAQIDSDRAVVMSRVDRRPRPGELPAELAQLAIGPTSLRWTGQPPTDDQQAALRLLPGDAPFHEQLTALIAARNALVVRVPFAAPVRPTLDAGHPLADKLVIGRALLRVHGLLVATDVDALGETLAIDADRRALARLYTAALDKGMRGRELRIRALRGSAPPSPLVPFERVPVGRVSR